MESRTEFPNKGDRTSQCTFDDYCYTFQSHVEQVNLLREHLKRYFQCVSNTREALTTIGNDVIHFFHLTWPNARILQSSIQDQDTLWRMYEQHLQNVNHSFEAYMKQMRKIQECVRMRHSKLKEWNEAREQLKKAYCTKTDDSESSIRKAEAELMNCQEKYDMIHRHLMRDFPIIMASRMELMVQGIGTLFNATYDFYRQLLEVQETALDAVEDLPNYSLQFPIGKEEQKFCRLATTRKQPLQIRVQKKKEPRNEKGLQLSGIFCI